MKYKIEERTVLEPCKKACNSPLFQVKTYYVVLGKGFSTFFFWKELREFDSEFWANEFIREANDE